MLEAYRHDKKKKHTKLIRVGNGEKVKRRLPEEAVKMLYTP